MMELGPAEARAKAAEDAAREAGAAALAAEKAKDAALQEVEALKAVPGAPPAAMLINSCKVRAIFGPEKFKKVTPPPLDLGVAGGTRGRARVQQLEGVEQELSKIRYVFHSEMDVIVRDACVACGAVTPL